MNNKGSHFERPQSEFVALVEFLFYLNNTKIFLFVNKILKKNVSL